uniref:Uncharacterized protein n=1 Tax=Gasterosteus aculeatus TaxID=69293 RepID=G3N967_GASAC
MYVSVLSEVSPPKNPDKYILNCITLPPAPSSRLFPRLFCIQCQDSCREDESLILNSSEEEWISLDKY